MTGHFSVLNKINNIARICFTAITASFWRQMALSNVPHRGFIICSNIHKYVMTRLRCEKGAKSLYWFILM
ncbi:hypothetical protein EDC63_1361 [Sulfurirhabdus autotrophica]|uniref:Uncharacterized protein n=1 Tax=Sulfurirhabdus autotrophica TaxID=1706046 RepID=A0A4R3XRI2_9PROT|nr:hypothetical protein EDC63_1361 [Sulfurirhabdus autotrophica]